MGTRSLRHACRWHRRTQQQRGACTVKEAVSSCGQSGGHSPCARKLLCAWGGKGSSARSTIVDSDPCPFVTVAHATIVGASFVSSTRVTSSNNVQSARCCYWPCDTLTEVVFRLPRLLMNRIAQSTLPVVKGAPPTRTCNCVVCVYHRLGQQSRCTYAPSKLELQYAQHTKCVFCRAFRGLILAKPLGPTADSCRMPTSISR